MWSPGLSPSLGGWPSLADPLEADNQGGSTSVQLQKPRPVLAESCAVAAYEAGVPVSGPQTPGAFSRQLLPWTGRHCGHSAEEVLLPRSRSLTLEVSHSGVGLGGRGEAPG